MLSSRVWTDDSCLDPYPPSLRNRNGMHPANGAHASCAAYAKDVGDLFDRLLFPLMPLDEHGGVGTSSLLPYPTIEKKQPLICNFRTACTNNTGALLILLQGINI